MTNRDEIRRQLDTDGVKYLLTQFVDIHGAAKVKLVPVASFDDVVDSGAGFAGGALNGMGQGPHSHDMLAKIDLDTYTPLPWDPEVARFASDLFVDDLPHPYCPRQNMKRILNSARERGFVFKVGIEPEHFLVTRTGKNEISIWDPSDTDSLEKPCYDFKGISGVMGYLREMMDGLNGLGWGVYQSDHEDANGQFEINFHYDDALVTADRYTFFKMMTSQVARKFGAIATHMPKPFSNRTGSAGHIHFHVADVNTGNNLFLDMDDPRGLGLSQAAYHFIGGILDHAPALCAVNSPTVNCYKRLQVGSALLGSRSGFTWTPAFISYGDNNRTQMIRTAGPGHLEERTMSSGCNPYLAFSAYLNAGLDGIDRKLDPGEPFLGNLYDLGLDKIQQSGIRLLPQTLKEAILELKSDSVIQDALGPIYEEFTALKEQEWRDYHRQVSDWEIDRYLTLF
ncbi:type III glutamate--ammonia ligase [SAR202 cluster bacterium AD-804-J14_MRT_500m]|nr:type III glutamate--ammonia ligase [SAR202 cluster bacterium AD-804-J14_MRT_500m]